MIRTFLATTIAASLGTVYAQQEKPAEPLSISGIYPQLAMFNKGGECGIGAVVPWAGKLWTITYPPHQIKGSDDKLYSISPDMQQTIQPESVGGTHACRFIHEESKQLIIGPYFIDEQGHVRACDVKNKLIGRMTAVARHLTDPANKVYFYDMEGAVYEVDVHSLEVTKLFEKPVPGWHGKGAYTAQGRLVVANNGEASVGGVQQKFLAKLPEKSPEDAGVLAEWDGKEWRIVERHQFTDVTGPGGIKGNAKDSDPLWTMGWDKRSVILKVLDGGEWHTFRTPKGSHAFDPKHGWYTEWPRIREVFPGQWMMVMHGQMFQFPQTFSAQNTAGIRPMSTHLRYIPDFCGWNDRVVLAADDTSIMQNPMAGQSQSNLWFGKWDDLSHFGPAAGWGGVWLGDGVKAGKPSDPFLVNGYAQKVLHLAHRAEEPVTFTIEADRDGNNQWQSVAKVNVPAGGYGWHIFPTDLKAQWVRIVADRDCTASAYFHVASPRAAVAGEAKMFDGLGANDAQRVKALIRPGANEGKLQVFVTPESGGQEKYYEVDAQMAFAAGAPSADAQANRPKLELKADVSADAASVVATDCAGKRWRLPRFDDSWQPEGQRGAREVQSERFVGNWGGLFYELPRTIDPANAPAPEFQHLRPIAAHKLGVTDYCNWRGLLVMSGVRADAKADGHVFRSADGGCALWFGAVDDLWKLGAPRGHGGPWLDTAVKAGAPSDPYLMTNFARKKMTLRHNGTAPVKITVEVDFTNTGNWRTYQVFEVPAGKEGVTHEFPAGYSAYWMRFTADQPCTATAQLVYDEA